MQYEAELRKERSIEILKKRGIPYLEDHPLIETEDDADLRPMEEIAKRALITIIIASYASGLKSDNDITEDQDFFMDLLKKYDLEETMTVREKKFMNMTRLDKKEAVQLSWRYEAGFVLMWALGFVPELYYPDKVCNTNELIGLVRDYVDFADFFAEADMREKSEILDEADLIYRYCWAAVEALFVEKEMKAPGGMEWGVLTERHAALNWLIGLGDDFESVPIDT